MKLRSLKRELQLRDRRQWTARFVLLAIVIGISAHSFLNTLANVTAQSSREIGYKLAPENGVIAAKYAEFLVSTSLNARPDSEAVTISRKALVREPLAVEALTVLALSQRLQGHQKASNELLKLSTRMSRRELQPRLWEIENAVQRGQLDEVLRQYDIALRTSSTASGILFPILSAALTEPLVRQRVTTMLSHDPIWGSKFMEFVSGSSTEPLAGAIFFEEARRSGVAIDEELRVNLINTLWSKGDFKNAWKFYSALRRGVRRNFSRDPNFNNLSQVRAPFDWQPSSDPDISVAILRDGKAGVFEYAAPPGFGSTALTQAQMLSAGQYRLSGHASIPSLPKRFRPYWSLKCDDGRELERVMLPAGGEHRSFTGRLTVPANCPIQTLALVIRSTDRFEGVEGRIHDVHLVPSGPR